MKQYLVQNVLHRLDRRTVVSMVEITRNRVERVIIDTDEIVCSFITGLAYEVKLSYRTGRPQLVYARAVSLTSQSLKMATERGVIGGELRLPTAIKKLIHKDSNGISTWLNHPDICDLQAPIQEPYASQLWLETRDRHHDQQILTELISVGLNQQQAERYLMCYRDTAISKLMAMPLSALPFVNHTALILKPRTSDADHSAIAPLGVLFWLQKRADQGQTLCDRDAIPLTFSAVLETCIDNNWVEADEIKIQLKSHALLQSRLRKQLEVLTNKFFPTYSHHEMEFAYSRLAGLSSGRVDIDFLPMLSQLINQRVVLLTYSTMSEVSSLIEQYSAFVQTLHWEPPQIITYAAKNIPALSRLLPYEEIGSFYSSSVPSGQTSRSQIVIDFDLFTVSDLVVLLDQVGRDDQVILISHSDIESYIHSREFHFAQLQGYFQHLMIGSSAATLKHLPAAKNAFIDEAIIQGRTIISDDIDTIERINDRPKSGGPPKLVTAHGSYYKNEPVLFHPRGARHFDSFIGTIISTSDKGVMVNVAGAVMLLTNEFVDRCRTSTAYAIDVCDAARIGLNQGVLFTSRHHSVVTYLEDSGTEILEHYCLPSPSGNAVSPTGQRVVPVVEG